MWLTDKQINRIFDGLRSNRTTRRILPGGGRLFIDRQLPFIALYRNTGEKRNIGMDKMTSGQASLLSAPAGRQFRPNVRNLLLSIAEIMKDRFGAFLIMELWPGEIPENNPNLPPRPLFKVYTTKGNQLNETAACLKNHLEGIRTSKLAAEVISIKSSRATPPEQSPCIPSKDMREHGIMWIGLEISPIYINQDSNKLYPMLYRAVRRQVSRAMAQAFFTFTDNHTTHHPPHFHTLGRRAVVKAVWEVDRKLAEIGNSFDLLRLVTPINAEAAWQSFQRSRFQKPPRFLYLPRPVDPGEMKRRLFSIPLEKVEDPTLQRLFIDKRLELDRELTLMTDLNREAFRFGSQQLHGTVKTGLLRLAEDLLADSIRGRKSRADNKTISAEDFLKLAENEISTYRKSHPEFHGSARISPEMYGGILVSKGELIIGRNSTFPASRSDSLIQHEVGTHILTWSNGLAQPLQLFAAGLPRYEEFQEGIAVLAEYLCGGLDPQRLDTIAARVIAVKAMISNADFIEVFRLLTNEYGFTQRSAYLITMRVFRGGGFAKDAVYLRGLTVVLKYISSGGNFENCFAGKMGGEHMPVYEELLLRRILKPPAVKPVYIERPEVKERLAKLAEGMTVRDLIEDRR